MKDKLIKFIAADRDIFTYHAPTPSSKVIPDWFKNLPTSHEKVKGYMSENNTPTIKRCMPVMDYLTSGYVLKNPYQVAIKPVEDPNGFIDYTILCANAEYIGRHPWHQVKTQTNGQNKHFIKFNHGWVIETPPGYSCMIYQPHYIFRNEFVILPAVVDTDQHNDAISLVASVNTKQEFVIESGAPLAVVFPFKRDSWTSQLELDPFIQTKSSYTYYFRNLWHGTYQKFFHNKKSFK
jgi:hypothetical protein